VLISEAEAAGEPLRVMQNHQDISFLFREMLYRRAEFVGLVMEEIETWMNDPALKKVPSREKVTHSVCYARSRRRPASWAATAAEEIVAVPPFLAIHATRARMTWQRCERDVFIQDLIVAYKRGAIPNSVLPGWRARGWSHPRGSPNQGLWWEYKLFH